MAKYRVTDALGRSFVINGGDTPPTQEQVAQLIAGYDKGTETQTPSLTSGQRALGSLRHDFEDMGYGIKKGLSGVTLGASDWALRKLGITDDDYLARREAEGLGGAVKAAGFGAELGGNMLGAGGALVKGLGKSGLKGLKLASTAGGIEGGIQNSFDNDNLGWNTLGGTLSGAAGGSLSYGAGKLLGKGIVGAKRLMSKPGEDVKLLSKFGKDLGKISGNQQYADDLINSALLDANRRGKSIIEVAEDPIVELAQSLRQQTPEAGFILKNRLDLAKNEQPQAMRNFIDETLGTATRGDSVAAITEKARQEAAPIYRRLENMGDLERLEIANNLRKLSHTPFEPKMGLSAEQYASEVQRQADNLGMGISKGNPDKVNSGVMHFVLDKNGALSNRAPFVGSLEETVMRPDVSFLQGLDKNYVRALKNTNNGKNVLDNVVTRDGLLYTKYPTSYSNIAGKIKNTDTSNLSASPNLTSNTGISPFGEGNISLSKIGKIVNENDVIKDAIKSVKRAYSSLKNLPDTDFRVMNEARSLLSGQTVAPDATLAYQAKTALRELDPILDKVVPDYRIARGIYENAHKFEEASKLSKDIFSNSKNPSDFQYAVDKLGNREKDALAIGVRDDLLGKIGARENESLGFRSILPQNTQDKLKIALGEEKGNKIISQAKDAIRLNQNYNNLLRGSQTAEKLKKGNVGNLAIRLLKNPFGVVGEVSEPVSKVFRDRNNVKLAKLLTNQDLRGLREGLRQYNSIAAPNWIKGDNLSNLAAGLSATAYNNMRNWNR